MVSAHDLICCRCIYQQARFACIHIPYTCTEIRSELAIHALHSAQYHLDDSRSDKPLTRTLFSILCWKRSGGARPYRKFIKKTGKTDFMYKEERNTTQSPLSEILHKPVPYFKNASTISVTLMSDHSGHPCSSPLSVRPILIGVS